MSAKRFFGQWPDNVLEAIERYDAHLQQVLPGIQVMPDESGGVIGYAYGSGYKQTICTLIPSKKGLKLGFYKGTELPDPKGLLGGTGKVHRFVELDLQAKPSAALNALLKAALKAYHERMKA